MGKITIFGFKGSDEELKKLLNMGMTVQSVSREPKSTGIKVEYLEKTVGGRPPKYDKNQIRQLRTEGLSYGAVAKAVGCTKSYVIQVCKEAADE